MAIVTIPPWSITTLDTSYNDAATTVVDAAGESAAVIGQLRLAAGTGSKTISAAGEGAIYWRAGTPITFANAGSNLRIGVQDVSATTGLEDGTFDVYADLVGGTATITANEFQKSVMTGGTKTIAHGAYIAIVAELTGRGAADSVVLRRTSPTTATMYGNLPYGTVDTGTLAKAPQTWLFAVIEFDDGTIGWIEGAPLGINSVTLASVSFNSGSALDEYAGTFQLAAPVQISAITISCFNIASADTFELVLYSDPYGTPAVIETVTPDTDMTSATTTPGYLWAKVANVTLAAGTTYAVALRPTTTNNISVSYLNLYSGNGAIKAVTAFGSNAKFAARADQTGAFAEVEAHYLPLIGISISGLDNGVSSGGATARRGNMLGAFRV